MLAATDFGDYGFWLPPQISEHGGRVDSLIDVVHWFMAVLFVAWGLFYLYCLFRFRSREGHTATYELIKAKISKFAEVGVIVFEAFLLLGLSVPVWAEYKNDAPPEDDRFVVRVVAEQFQWNFHYPGADGIFGSTKPELINTATNPIGLDETDPAAKDDVWKIGELHLPTGRDIYIRLTSKDVIHSFTIPTMRVKQDVIPGMEIPIWFKIKPDATTENLRDEMTRMFDTGRTNWYRIRHYVSLEDYRDKSGQVILARGSDIGAAYQDGTKLLKQLHDAGVTEIKMQPRNPIEVVCAQLCGNSHFKMKAITTTYTQAGFDAWYKAELDRKNQEFEPDFD